VAQNEERQGRETLGMGREPFTSSVLLQGKEMKEGSDWLDISSGS